MYTSEEADFVPLILESTRAIHPRTIREIQAQVTLSDQHHPIHHSFTIRVQYWTHALSIAAVRSLCASKLTLANMYALKLLIPFTIFNYHPFTHSQSLRLLFYLIIIYIMHIFYNILLIIFFNFGGINMYNYLSSIEMQLKCLWMMSHLLRSETQHSLPVL